MARSIEEAFGPKERERLARYVTDVDGPVFALVGLPEVVKGALFARYSRSAKSLRRLLLDEFADDLADEGSGAAPTTRRADALYHRVLTEYGDDSVAQLGGVHLACEGVSNLLTKVLERGRLMSYLEQSTRYVRYDGRLPSGHYRYYRDPDLLASSLGARYVGGMDGLFEAYGSLLPEVTAWLARRYPAGGTTEDLAHRRAVQAAALDLLRGLLPAGALANVGIFGAPQAFERLIHRLRAHPLPEARRIAERILHELRKVVPAFLERVDLPDRGLAAVAYREATGAAVAARLRQLWPEDHEPGRPQGAGGLREGGPEVSLVDWDPDGELKVLAAICYPATGLPDVELVRRVARLDAEQRRALLWAYVGERRNRREMPGRAFERTAYRFDVVCDYGAFRDLQRHRMATIEWQPLGPDLGASVPPEIDEGGFGPRYRAALEQSADLYDALAGAWPEQARYALAMAYRVRFSMQLNAREAMHVLELRSQPQGHPAYRSVVQQMHRLIAEQAGHRLLAEAMVFVDHGDYALSRLAAEQRAQARRRQADDGADDLAAGGADPAVLG
ncbi:FAD-dependent thymidylate synthase [Aciditerrimonas ferrireducens]|jgi:thymidylate synthase ThyX|uniref:FAD-dependent thymidylate synthase n=1 Tax=Aciditerrimonas ferrireducens TaxID=667306 RepID=A0ABV6C4K1_9ACTN